MMPDLPSGSTSDVDRRIALAREWDDLVAQARELPGLEDFQRPPRLETLLPAAADGPVVILNVSRRRCDAMVVRPTGVTVVELDGLTPDDLARNVDEYLEGQGEARLDRCLKWMWDGAAAPGHRSPTPARNPSCRRGVQSGR